MSLAAAPTERPRLVLVLMLDQFRQEYMVRYRAQFVPGGFRYLLERGAVFANCNYPYTSTLTAPGHAVIATGAYPNAHGVIGNEWFDRASGRETKADRDVNEKLVGTPPDSPGASPHWLIGSTLADELRLATTGRSRAIGISPKGRSAILMVGKSANAAYWFDNATLHAISSTFYMKELPGWVRRFNAQDWAAKYASK
ncbi:MAG: alkaline phosphatase family protein, partial [Gammaproteobacteria bacterium]